MGPAPLHPAIRGSLWISLLGIAGCPALGIAAAGTLTGQILYDGRPAPGKLVSLLVFQNGQFTAFDGSGNAQVTATTDAAGNYRFSGIPPGTYKVVYLPKTVSDGAGLPLPTGEVAVWRTLPGPVSASAGTTFPPFDVAYDGLIYPQTGKTYYVTADVPLPFHWSTDVQGQRYDLQIFPDSDASGKTAYTSGWVTDPTWLFRQNVNSVVYSWNVEIDGGNAGEGTTAAQILDMAPPAAPPSSGS